MIRSLASTCASRDVSAGIRRFQLGLAQHAAQLLGADLLIQHGVHLVQGEAEVFSTMMWVEPCELDGLAEPIAAGWALPGRTVTSVPD